MRLPEPLRTGRLLVEVRALSGRSYPAGTCIRFRGRGEAADAWVGGDWMSLSWWEFTPIGSEPPAPSG